MKEVPQGGNLAQYWKWGLCSGQRWQLGTFGVGGGSPQPHGGRTQSEEALSQVSGHRGPFSSS